MKKALVRSLLLALGAAALPGAHISLRLGLCRSELYPPPVGEKSLASLRLCAGIGMKLAPNLWLQPEIHYVRKGTASAYPDLPDDDVAKIMLDCLEFPLLLKWRFFSSEKVCLILSAGGYAAWIFHACAYSVAERVKGYTNLMDEVRFLDAGLAIGVDLEKSWKSRNVLAGIRYHQGLVDIKNSASDARWQPAAFSLLLGIRL